jgi:uncharacterized membrane protein YebE (DUF533 family)
VQAQEVQIPIQWQHFGLSGVPWDIGSSMVLVQKAQSLKKHLITAFGALAGLSLMAYGREQMWHNKDEARAVAQARAKKFKELVSWRSSGC